MSSHSIISLTNFPSFARVLTGPTCTAHTGHIFLCCLRPEPHVNEMILLCYAVVNGRRVLFYINFQAGGRVTAKYLYPVEGI